jgi:mono/diheme cytochrome c family protein
MRLIRWLVFLGILGLGAFWFLTRPSVLTESDFAGLSGDATRGQAVFLATGCASCHMVEGAKGDAQLILAGGQRFPSPFGTFVAPNISSDPTQGIGGWSLPDFANAITRGVSPEGTHYFPALPYGAYNKLALQDVADLHAYVATLPADATPSQPHEVGFPFNIRRTLGGWKLLFLSSNWTIPDPLSPAEQRGRYLVEAAAHCAECHTPRNALGGLDRSRWLAGVIGPDGKELAPNITPAVLEWSEQDIVAYLTTGFTPEYDSVGGHMAHVVENMARLPESDRAAVAAYLKKVPPVAAAAP